MARRRWARCRGGFENMFCWRTCIHIKYINTHDTYTRTQTQYLRVSCMHTHIHTQVGSRTCSAGESVYTYTTLAHTIHKHTHTRSIRGYDTYTHTQPGGCENMFRWRKCITYYTYNTYDTYTHTQPGGCENMFRWRKCITYYTYNTYHTYTYNTFAHTNTRTIFKDIIDMHTHAQVGSRTCSAGESRSDDGLGSDL